MTLYALLFSTCCVLFMAWLLIKMLSNKKKPPDNEDDGGLGGNGNLPIIDLPPSTKISDWLTDRVPKEKSSHSRVKSISD